MAFQSAGQINYSLTFEGRVQDVSYCRVIRGTLSGGAWLNPRPLLLSLSKPDSE